MGKTILTSKQFNFLEFVQAQASIIKSLVAAFLKVKDFKKEDYPKMLITFNQQKMEDFFIKLAKSLKKEILK